MNPSDLIKGAFYQGQQFKRRHPMSYTGITGTLLDAPIWVFEAYGKNYDFFEYEIRDLVKLEIDTKVFLFLLNNGMQFYAKYKVGEEIVARLSHESDGKIQLQFVTEIMPVESVEKFFE